MEKLFQRKMNAQKILRYLREYSRWSYLKHFDISKEGNESVANTIKRFGKHSCSQ